MVAWQTTDELSKEKEKAKRVMIYYAAPIPHKYGYFSSTVKARRDEFLHEVRGREAYEEDCRRIPYYVSYTKDPPWPLRKTWNELEEAARESWRNDPTPHDW